MKTSLQAMAHVKRAVQRKARREWQASLLGQHHIHVAAAQARKPTALAETCHPMKDMLSSSTTTSRRRLSGRVCCSLLPGQAAAHT